MADLLLIVDLETTGLDPKEDEVIEIGAILYSVTEACTLQQFSTLYPVTNNPAEKINRISATASQVLGEQAIAPFIELIQSWIDKADYLVAHNAQFDSQWFGKNILPRVNKPWLCTYDDFVWSRNEKPTSLINTALNYGIGVSSAHRALTDCQLIAALFDRVGELGELKSIVENAIQRSKEPKFRVVAKVSYGERQLAKDHKFYWDSNKKYWFKELRESDLILEQDNYPFSIKKSKIKN